MKKLLFAAAAAVLFAGCQTCEGPKDSGTTFKRDALQKCVDSGKLPGAVTSAVPFKLGIAGYSFCGKSGKNVDDALKVMQDIDCHYLCIKDFHLKYSATDEEIAAFKEKCAKAGVTCLGAGPLYFDNEKDARMLFDFARRYGLKVVVGVPFEKGPDGKGRFESDAMLDVVDKLVKEYDIPFAIHNHGPDMPKLYPTAEAALKRIGNRDKRIGVCLDIGHEYRFGLDPAAFIRAHGDRIYDVHIKNIKGDKKKGRMSNTAMPGPRGVLDIPGVMKALADVGYAGVCHIEYERDFDRNEMGLAESVGYYRGVMDSVVVKARMMPVPEGANALTDEEKAEGFELLFDGKELPADKWVGANKEWGFAKFPTRGWFVKDGALTMRPVKGISPTGQWFPLPPEDQKLGGAGDIVTKKLYKDFVFKFDFRLTAAANSGVKYFYNEGVHKSSCEEYQILEPGHPDSDKGRNGNRRVASLYDILPAPGADAAVRPAGQWNSGMIVAKGKHVEHWLNGKKVLEYERGSAAFREGVAKSKYLAWQDAGAFWGEAEKGRLLLQDHSDSTVSFCNLKVREL